MNEVRAHSIGDLEAMASVLVDEARVKRQRRVRSWPRR
jgi:hypothetical protein